MRVRDLEARSAFRGLGRIPSDEREHVEAGGAQRTEMRDAAEPRPDDGNTRHAFPRLSDRSADLRVQLWIAN